MCLIKSESPRFLFEGYCISIDKNVQGSYLFQPIYDNMTKKTYHHWIVRKDGYKVPVDPKTISFKINEQQKTGEL